MEEKTENINQNQEQVQEENQEPVQETKKVRKNPFETRIHEIDFIRGLLMCLVILDHLLNLLMIFNRDWCGGMSAIEAGTAKQPFLAIYQAAHWYWNNPIRIVVRWLCLGGFCFVSGISSAFSKNNWKRAGEMIVLWMIIMLGSNVLHGLAVSGVINMGVPNLRVDFNIIGVLAWSTLIYCFVQDKSWKWLLIIMIIGLVLHPICVLLSNTDWAENVYAPMLWKPSDAIAKQADYMPLFPYLGFFFGGALLSKFTYSVSKKSYFKKFNFERPICFVGRHSLIIYISHFLILIGIFSFVGLFIK